MNSTVELLRFIGSPYLSSSFHSLAVGNRLQLLQYSLKNRFSLLYLDALKQRKALGTLGETYDQQMVKYIQTFEAVARISRALTDANVEHAVFKTLRPYISTTVDIDVIIFGDTLDYERAIKAARCADYQEFPQGPMSTTFVDPKMKIGVDLYNEVAVSHMPYIDKTILADSITDTELPRREKVKTLTCEADLVAIIAHSIIKENMYTLAEYYTYIYYLEKLDVDRLIQLTRKTHLKTATRTHTAITALLFEVAHKTLHYKLQQILDKVGLEKIETARVIANDFRMPHKYHPVSIARCLLEIARGEKTRKGIANQIIHSFNTGFLKDFLKKLNEHMTRETY